MDKLLRIFKIQGLSGLLLFPMMALQLSAQQQPNILIIVADDLGYHDLSCNGSAIYQTPNIDNLAKNSVAFSGAYANYPRCVPSRYALMTGRYPMVAGQVPDDGFSMEDIPAEQNFIHMFNELGYHTAFFGKWHLGEGQSSPRGLGYGYSIAAGKPGSPISYFYPFNEFKGNNQNTNKAPIPDVDSIAAPGDYLTDVLTDQVIEYFDRDLNQPFLAVVAFYAVHQPLEAKQADIEVNKVEIENHDFGNQPEYISEGTGRTKMRQDNPVYAAMVENLDDNVGRIMQTLEEKKLLENTLVIFTSDHGGLSNDGINRRNLATSNFPLRAGKGWMYEGGIRVPLLFHYPEVWKPRRDTTAIVMLMDVFPTLLDWTGLKAIPALDGISILSILEGSENGAARTVFWHSNMARPRQTGENNASAIRSGDWKLIHFYEEDSIELYNLRSDISEQHNLANQYPEKVAVLLQKIIQWKGGR